MFIPKERIRVGSKVELDEDVKVLAGTFTKGHRFTVIGEGERGFDLEDEDGNKLLETRFVNLKLVEE